MEVCRLWVAVCAVSCLYLSSASAEDAKEKPGFCKLYPQEGECGQFHLRWYYNEKRNECYQFMYRGCKGNENNFFEKNECMKTCGNGVPGEKTENTEPAGQPAEKTEETVKETSEKINSSHSATEKKTPVEDQVVLSTASSKEEVKEDSKETVQEDAAEEPVFGDEDEKDEEEEEEEENDAAEEGGDDEEEDPDLVLEDVFSKGILNKDIISPEDMGTLKQLVSDMTVYGMEEVPSNEADEDNEEDEERKEEEFQENGDLSEDQGADQEGEGQTLESDVTGGEDLTDNSPMTFPATQEQHLDGDHAGELTPEEAEGIEEMYLDEEEEDGDDEFDDDDDDEDDDDDMVDPLELLDEAQDLGVFDQNAMSEEDRNTLVNVMLQGTTYLTRDGHVVKSSHPSLPQAYDADDDDNYDDQKQTEISTEEDGTMEDAPEAPSKTDQQTSQNTGPKVPEIEDGNKEDKPETEEEEEVDNVDEILESAEKRGVFDGSAMSPEDKDTLTNLMSRLSVYELMPEEKEGVEEEEEEAGGVEENEEEQAGDGSITNQEGDAAMVDADYFDEDESENGAGLLEMDPFGSVLDSEEPQFMTTPPPIYEKEQGKATLRGQAVPPMCFFKADSGPCKAKRRQWFYDFGRKKCMPFYYGGCLGNGNRFRSEAHCMSKCMGGIKLPVVQQPPMKLGPTMKVLEKFGPFKKIPTFMSLLAKPLMRGGKVRITLPSSGQPKPDVSRQGLPISIMKAESRQFPQVPSMPRIVPVPRTQQPNPPRPRLPMQRMVNTPFVPPPPPLPRASINIPMMKPKVAPPMNEVVPKPMMTNPLMEKYPMLKVMFFKKHSPKQYVSPTVSKSNTLMSRHQDNRYQMHSSPKNGLSLTQIFVNKPALSAQANPTDFTFKHKGSMDKKGWKRRGGWDEVEEERDDRRWRRGRKERRMREEWDNREPTNQEIHHYHHYPQPAPPTVHKPPVVFFPPPPPQRPPMAWHPPLRPILPMPPRGHGQFLLQLLTKKRVPFEHRATLEVSTENPDQQWQEEPEEYWEDDDMDMTDVLQEQHPVDREPSYVCLLPVDSGRCKALDKKWYFNKEKGACETFFYGGCGGNANNFDSPEECRDACLEYTRPDEIDKEEVIEVVENEDEEEEQQQQDTPKEEEEQAVFDNGQIETSTIMVQEDLIDQEGDTTKEPTRIMNSPAIEESDIQDSKDHTIQLEGGPHYTLLLVIVCVVGLLLLLLIGVAIVHVLRKSRDMKKEKVIEAVVKSNLYSDLPKFVYAPPPPTPPTPTKESA